MGRTKRRRLRKRNQTKIKFLDRETVVINLMQWMYARNWNNSTKLRLGCFPDTGRGTFSTKNIKGGQVLLEIPFDLMITYITLENSTLFESVLKNRKEEEMLSICDMLAIFILFEHHIGDKSMWKHYLDSLPNEEMKQIWLCNEDEMQCLPKELVYFAEKERENAVDSIKRVMKVINGDNKCPHCDKKVSDILTKNTFMWNYIVVNTRCVYVCPDEIDKLSRKTFESLLLDQPNCALCPFMDMINHSNTVTNSFFSSKDNTLKYGLETGTTFKKFNEVFISYGAYDNRRLLSQYGFILPQNKYDSVHFTLKEIIKVCKLEVSSRQFKFLQKCKLDTKLTIDNTGNSFNMAAVLYVMTNEDELNWPVAIYSYKYTAQQLLSMDALSEMLLNWKLEQYIATYERVKVDSESFSRHFRLCIGFAANRIDFVKSLINNLLKKRL